MAAESSGETDNEAQLSRASSFTSLGESLLPPARKRKARDEDLSAVYAFAPCASRRANIGGGSFQSGGGAFEPLDEAVELVGAARKRMRVGTPFDAEEALAAADEVRRQAVEEAQRVTQRAATEASEERAKALEAAGGLRTAAVRVAEAEAARVREAAAKLNDEAQQQAKAVKERALAEAAQIQREAEQKREAASRALAEEERKWNEKLQVTRSPLCAPPPPRTRHGPALPRAPSPGLARLDPHSPPPLPSAAPEAADPAGRGRRRRRPGVGDRRRGAAQTE